MEAPCNTRDVGRARRGALDRRSQSASEVPAGRRPAPPVAGESRFLMAVSSLGCDAESVDRGSTPRECLRVFGPKKRKGAVARPEDRWPYYSQPCAPRLDLFSGFGRVPIDDRLKETGGMN